MKIRRMIAVLSIGGLLVGGSHGADPKPEAAKTEGSKSVEDDRTVIADKLMVRMNLDRIEQMPFKDVVELLADKLDVTILYDGFSLENGNAGQAAQIDGAEVNQRPISLPALKKVRGETALQLAANRVGATYLIYPDHIRIVGLAVAAEIVQIQGPVESEDGPALAFLSTKLVNVHLVERPLPEALKSIERRTGITIALAPQAGDKAKTAITAEFSNVPVERAVATVAEMAGLKLVKQGNVLLVTTQERAKDLGDGSRAMRQVPTAIDSGSGGVFQGDESARAGARLPPDWGKGIQKETAETDALKKRVAELEKQLEGTKKKSIHP